MGAMGWEAQTDVVQATRQMCSQTEVWQEFTTAVFI